MNDAKESTENFPSAPAMENSERTKADEAWGSFLPRGWTRSLWTGIGAAVRAEIREQTAARLEALEKRVEELGGQGDTLEGFVEWDNHVDHPEVLDPPNEPRCRFCGKTNRERNGMGCTSKDYRAPIECRYESDPTPEQSDVEGEVAGFDDHSETRDGILMIATQRGRIPFPAGTRVRVVRTDSSPTPTHDYATQGELTGVHWSCVHFDRAAEELAKARDANAQLRQAANEAIARVRELEAKGDPGLEEAWKNPVNASVGWRSGQVPDSDQDQPTPARLIIQKVYPCGCVSCICEDDEQCHGCGARSCESHPGALTPDQPTPAREGMPVVGYASDLGMERMKDGAVTVIGYREPPFTTPLVRKEDAEREIGKVADALQAEAHAHDELRLASHDRDAELTEMTRMFRNRDGRLEEASERIRELEEEAEKARDHAEFLERTTVAYDYFCDARDRWQRAVSDLEAERDLLKQELKAERDNQQQERDRWQETVNDLGEKLQVARGDA